MLEGFSSKFGAAFYGLDCNKDKIKLKKNARQYSIFRHFIQFQKIIEKN